MDDSDDVDFTYTGVAKLLKAGHTNTQVGTPYYISPEIWKKQPYNSKSDVWSLGCVLYELATFRHPFTADSPKALSNKILLGRYLPIPSEYSSDLSLLIAKTLGMYHIIQSIVIIITWAFMKFCSNVRNDIQLIGIQLWMLKFGPQSQRSWSCLASRSVCIS